MYSLYGILESNKETKILKTREEESPHGSRKYTFVNYNKRLLTSFNCESYGLFRSVITDENENILCFSPPKAVTGINFIHAYNDPSHKDILCEETVEGTMINAFYDNYYHAWQLVTKQKFANKIYGASVFADSGKKVKLTIEEIFLETFKKVTGNPFNDINDILDKKFCYSFVLQHPSNYVVIPCKVARLTLVAVYQIVRTTIVQIYDAPVPPGIFTPVCYNSSLPKSLTKEEEGEVAETNEVTYTELIEKYASMNAPYTVAGITIFHRLTGERCKIRNPAYETIRHLKGMDTKLMYQYLSLRTNSKTFIEKYVQQFPEYKKKFIEFRDQLYLFTQTLYENYVKCYIKREITKENIPKQFKIHISNLHSIYLNKLVHKKLYINFREVVNYISELHPRQLVYSLTMPVTGI